LKCNGTLDRNLPNSKREAIINRSLGLDPSSAAEAKRRLLEVGFIDKNWQPSAWDTRQYSSDISSQRVRKYRKNKEIGNVSETFQNRFGNAPDTDTECPDTESFFNTSFFIFDCIKKLNPKQKEPNYKSWGNTIRLMIERDGRTEDEIKHLFLWANNHSFWKSNILSPEALRKQWDKLVIQRDNVNEKNNRTSSVARTREATKRWLDEAERKNAGDPVG
jgi:hypothetical protein